MSRHPNRRYWLAGCCVALLAAGVGFGLYSLHREPPVAGPAPVVASLPVDRTAVPVTPTARPPAPVPPPEAPDPLLPSLDASDTEVRGGLIELFGEPAVRQFLVPETIVRNIVVTLDNAPREKISLEQRPLQPTPGEFLTAGPEDARVLAPENYTRYQPFIAAVETIDARMLVALYRSYKPLFQQAYEELGYPGASFDARLLEVIDHLLAAPNPSAPIRLAQPGLLYTYADAQLESRSAGHKLLMRLGPDNAAVIKAKLREIRAELARDR